MRGNNAADIRYRKPRLRFQQTYYFHLHAAQQDAAAESVSATDRAGERAPRRRIDFVLVRPAGGGRRAHLDRLECPADEGQFSCRRCYCCCCCCCRSSLDRLRALPVSQSPYCADWLAWSRSIHARDAQYARIQKRCDIRKRLLSRRWRYANSQRLE